MPSVLMVLTSVEKFPDGSPTGWYLPEAAHPYYKFKEAGYDVTWASIGGTALCDPSSIDATKEDAECVKFAAEEMAKTTNQAKLADVDASTYDVLFFVGGFGTMWVVVKCCDSNVGGTSRTQPTPRRPSKHPGPPEKSSRPYATVPVSL